MVKQCFIASSMSIYGPARCHHHILEAWNPLSAPSTGIRLQKTVSVRTCIMDYSHAQFVFGCAVCCMLSKAATLLDTFKLGAKAKDLV